MELNGKISRGKLVSWKQGTCQAVRNLHITEDTISYFYYLFFHRRPTHKLCFLSCRPFIVNATFSTVLAYRKENTTCEWNDSGKIGNKVE